LPEVVGETAVTLSPHNQQAWSQTLHDLLSDPDARQQMVTAGFQQVRQFTWQKSARQLLAVYNALHRGN
jgi:glycosyltransferase involved in cell wall biosynthesis